MYWLIVSLLFRKADARDVITPVSTVKVKNLLEKNYNTYSLDNMQALAAGYNGSLWNQGDALMQAAEVMLWEFDVRTRLFYAENEPLD